MNKKNKNMNENENTHSKRSFHEKNEMNMNDMKDALISSLKKISEYLNIQKNINEHTQRQMNAMNIKLEYAYSRLNELEKKVNNETFTNDFRIDTICDELDSLKNGLTKFKDN